MIALIFENFCKFGSGNLDQDLWVNILPNAQGEYSMISFFWQIQKDKDFSGGQGEEGRGVVHDVQ